MGKLTAHQIEAANYETEIVLQTTTCCACHITFAAPQRMLDDARNDSSISIYCPAGHSFHWPGETREQHDGRAPGDQPGDEGSTTASRLEAA